MLKDSRFENLKSALIVLNKQIQYHVTSLIFYYKIKIKVLTLEDIISSLTLEMDTKYEVKAALFRLMLVVPFKKK